MSDLLDDNNAPSPPTSVPFWRVSRSPIARRLSKRNSSLPRLPPRRLLPHHARHILGAPAQSVGDPIRRKGAASIVSLPFKRLGGLLQLIFRRLRHPLKRASSYRVLSEDGSSTPRPASNHSEEAGLAVWRTLDSLTEDPATVAPRLVRDLEEETGALTLGRAAAASSKKAPEQTQVLPDFFLGSFEQALEAAEVELKALCIILLSSDSDGNAEFKRTVLTDPDLVRMVTDNGFIVWVGDIESEDGRQASQNLESTTYPFVAFVLLHPVLSQSGNHNSGSGPCSPILSRHQGSSTSASTLVAHITTYILPRLPPLLSRIRAENLKRAEDCAIREEQDRAFAETERRDKKRIHQRLAEERARQEATRKREHARAARELKEKNVAAWRRYARRTLVVPEPSAPSMGIQLAVRLPGGKRIVRSFSREDTTDSVYTFAETLLIPAGEDAADDPVAPPEEYREHEWSFGIVTSCPRTEIPASKVLNLGSIPELRGGATLVLESRSVTHRV